MTNEEKYFAYEWRYRKEDLKFCPRCGARFALQDIHIAGQPQLVCDSCRFIFYVDPKVVVAALVTWGDRILLLRRAEEPGYGKWAFPGGYMERGEDPAETVAREVMEEAGVEARIEGILTTYASREEGSVQLVYAATAESGRTRVNIESLEARFFAWRDIPWNQLAFCSTHETLRGYGAKRGLAVPVISPPHARAV